MRPIAAGIAVLGLLMATLAVGSARGEGAAPGLFYFTFHKTAPLLKQESYWEYERIPDVKGALSNPVEQAGARSDLSTLSVLNVTGTVGDVFDGIETPSDLEMDIPPGIAARLDRFPACPPKDFQYSVVYGIAESPCPPASQVGVVGSLWEGKEELYDRTYPLYKLETPDGHMAALGMAYEVIYERVPIVWNVDLRTDGDYGLTISRQTPSKFEYFLPAPFMTLWGVPGDPIHDAERYNLETRTWGGIAIDGPHPPLVANASNCDSGVLEAKLRLRYRNGNGPWLPEDPEDPSYRAAGPAPTGCEALHFEPKVAVDPSTDRYDSATGLALRMESPQAPDTANLDTPPLKEAALTLPSGMSLNPAATSRLGDCGTEQIGLRGVDFPAPNPIRFSAEAAHCPEASRVGTATVESPLVDAPIEGDIYLATPFDNPYRSLLAFYLVLNAPSFTAKLPARVDVDPASQRLTVTVDSLPQLPVEGVRLNLFDGPNALLATPEACGAGTATARLTPWSAPQSGPPISIQGPLKFDAAPTGAPCSQGGPPSFSPGFEAGVNDTTAAASSPFGLRISRPDGDRPLKRIAATLPRGLVASLPAGDGERCGEAEIARARERSAPGKGIVERADPSCPAASKVGSLLVDVGSGPNPLRVNGAVYRSGPYRGAPASLVAITPAVAGGKAAKPLFDLGAVVSRIALRVDPRTAQIDAESDPLPQAIAGIPLRIRRVTVVLDKPGFLRNPSGCEEKKVTAAIESQDGTRDELVRVFQLGDCRRLGFQPRLSIRAEGGTRPGGHPQLRAVLTTKPGDAGISRVRVTLPPALGLDDKRLEVTCDAAQLAQRACPAGSIVGRALASSPSLGQPVEGPVYLTPSAQGGRPSLALGFGDQLPLDVVGTMRLRHGRTQVAFVGLPDVPLSRLVVSLRGAGRGFLVNRGGLCGNPVSFSSRFTAHNSRVVRQGPVLRTACEREK